MRILILLSFFILPQYLVGQTQIKRIELDSLVNTVYSDYRLQNTHKTTLDSSIHPLHFRMISYKSIIEIWEDSSCVLYGEMTTYVMESRSSLEGGTEDFYYEVTPLDSCQIRSIYYQFLLLNIEEIPLSQNIETWPGYYGSDYTFECLSGGHYYSQHFFASFINNANSPAVTIKQFTDSVKSICNEDENWSYALDQAAFSTATLGGMQVTKPKIRKYLIFSRVAYWIALCRRDVIVKKAE